MQPPTIPPPPPYPHPGPFSPPPAAKGSGRGIAAIAIACVALVIGVGESLVGGFFAIVGVSMGDADGWEFLPYLAAVVIGVPGLLALVLAGSGIALRERGAAGLVLAVLGLLAALGPLLAYIGVGIWSSITYG